MAAQFTVISGKGEEQRDYRILTAEERMKHFRNIVGSVTSNAQQVWGEIWKELQGSVTDGCLVLPDAELGFKPECGWPEFLEKVWLLKHYLDYVQRFSGGES